jgi:hydroxymethylpyrimidine/phosphomethylpyrimidine kinase
VKGDALVPVLTIAGSDPTGGAGIQGDLKTFHAHGVFGMSVVTALTAQNDSGVRSVGAVDPATVVAQLEAVLDQVTPSAAKTGMLHRPEVAQAVAGVLRRRPIRDLVVDPVLEATAGGSLSSPGLVEALRTEIAPLATLLTPNLPEAAALLGRPSVASADAEEAARALLDLGPKAVLVKGGHGTGPAVDVLVTPAGVTRLEASRVDTPHGHGAGCALAASIAARLALGDPLERAVEGAKAYVHRALGAAVALGRGRGPVRHDARTT